MQVALIPRLRGNMCQFVSTENSWHNICSTIDDKAILAPPAIEGIQPIGNY